MATTLRQVAEWIGTLSDEEQNDRVVDGHIITAAGAFIMLVDVDSELKRKQAAARLRRVGEFDNLEGPPLSAWSPEPWELEWR